MHCYFLSGGGKTLARSGQPQTLPITNYSPNNSKFFADFSIDWTRQKLQVVVDVTKCNSLSEESGDATSRPDCIFDLCPQTSSDVDWDTFKPVVHVYCDGTTVSLHGVGFASKDPVQKLTLGSSYDKTNITIEIDNEKGLTIDGNSTSLTATFLTALFNKSNLTIASQEGKGRMAGTYKSVKVVNKAVITNTTIPTGTATNLTYNGQTTWKATKNTPWEITTPIDWDTQQLIVTVDLDGVYAKDAEANRVVLCVTGADDGLGWVENSGRSIFYNFSSTQVQGYVLEGDKGNTGYRTYTNPLVFRYTKDGMYLGDEATPTHNSTRLANLLSQKNIKIGVNNEACSGTYTIQLASNDYVPAQTYVDNIMRETATVSFNAQNNVDVQLERTLSPEYWNTFCVPFTISEDVIAEKFGEGTQVYTFGSMNGNVMNFAHSTSIEAGKPYIVKPTNTVVNPTFTGVNIVESDPEKLGADGFFMQGTYGAKTDLTTDGTNLFLGDGNKFYKPSGTTTAKMKGLRAFFIVPQGTNFAALRANIDGTTTAIDELTTVVEQPTDNRIYNLQGQFVGTSFEGLHGVYVQNGKKVLVK